jgi:hypothetical protein
MRIGRSIRLALLACGLALAPSGTFAALDATDTTWDGSRPPEGVYFHWYEPSFYAGFAPRTQDPARLHIRVSRGSQVRVTVVLGDAELDAYLDDLALRRATYQELVDAKVIQLSTNREYERFTARLDEAGVAGAIRTRASLGPAGFRQQTAEIMSTLNPERVFKIRMPVQDVLARWHAALVGGGDQKLDLANAILPGRVNVTALSPDLQSALGRATDATQAGGPDTPAFRDAALAFLDKATSGRYRVRDGVVEAVEFTAIYPAGTADLTTTYKGEKLPDFGVTGIWPLIPRARGRGLLGMVDYISPNPGYGFIPILSYQYAGGIAYNAFHNAGVRCELGNTPFLPAAWRKAVSERDGKPMQNLWIVGRGPTSHGCTRLPSGHMSELRHLVPASSSALEQVVTFRNLPQCYDLFDIDGDGKPEVMGVQYYLAYRSNEHTPVRTWVSNRREPFYRWLYGDNVTLGDVGHVALKEVPICRFAGRKAQEADTLGPMPLYEAPFAPEQIQFYVTKVPFDSDAGFELNRELRKVGTGHTTDRGKLLLR